MKPIASLNQVLQAEQKQHPARVRTDDPARAHICPDFGQSVPDNCLISGQLVPKVSGNRTLLRLTGYGTPAPAGSKRAFAIRKGGKPTGQVVVTDAARRSRPWRDLISQEAGRVMGSELIDGPLELRLAFYVRRPKSHYRTGKNAALLRDSAPAYPTIKPDLTKLTRAVEDALNGIAQRDDCQFMRQLLAKDYGTPERVEIEIRRIGPQPHHPEFDAVLGGRASGDNGGQIGG